MGYIDLHTHSTASDGMDTPAELIEKAKRNGLSAIALTDHDTIDGLREAFQAASDFGINFIRGCEISTKSAYGEVHIVGLWLPEDCPELENFLAQVRSQRDNRNVLIIGRLRELGIDITLEEAAHLAKGTIGRPHIAQLLINKGYAADWDDAFNVYLGKNGKAFFPKAVPAPEKAIEILANSGATTVFAHPLVNFQADANLLAMIKSMAKSGLHALEAWHCSQNEEQTKEIIKLAEKFNLEASGGSDYHGSKRPGRNLGFANGETRIPVDVIGKLLAQRQKLGLPV